MRELSNLRFAAVLLGQAVALSMLRAASTATLHGDQDAAVAKSIIDTRQLAEDMAKAEGKTLTDLENFEPLSLTDDEQRTAALGASTDPIPPGGGGQDATFTSAAPSETSAAPSETRGEDGLTDEERAAAEANKTGG